MLLLCQNLGRGSTLPHVTAALTAAWTFVPGCRVAVPTSPSRITVPSYACCGAVHSTNALFVWQSSPVRLCQRWPLMLASKSGKVDVERGWGSARPRSPASSSDRLLQLRRSACVPRVHKRVLLLHTATWEWWPLPRTAGATRGRSFSSCYGSCRRARPAQAREGPCRRVDSLQLRHRFNGLFGHELDMIAV